MNLGPGKEKSKITRSNSLRKSLNPSNKGSNNIPPEEMKRIENEIEARLRLKLKVEYSQRYHLLQEQYDQEMMSSSITMSSSFFDNYSIASSQSYLNCRSSDSQSEISYNKQKYQDQLNEKQKNIQTLENLKNELSELLNLQEQLQDEERILASQIGEAYSKNSDLILELSRLREKSNKTPANDSSFEFSSSTEDINDKSESSQLDKTESLSENIISEDLRQTNQETQNNNNNNNDNNNKNRKVSFPFQSGKDAKIGQIWRKSPLFEPEI